MRSYSHNSSLHLFRCFGKLAVNLRHNNNDTFIAMKRLLVIAFFLLVLSVPATAQRRLIDAVDKTPVSIASILDAAGNMVGFTLSDGTFTDIPSSSYPITIRCIGYEQLVIETPQDKTYEIMPVSYELDEVVIVPVERNILKQTFYVREYFSLNTQTDTVTCFTEHMAHRFVSATEKVKYSGNTSLRIQCTRAYSRIKMFGKDSVASDSKPMFPSMLSVIDLYDEEELAHESLREQGGAGNIYEEKGKSGMSLIQKQNAHTFTVIEDVLAEKEGHSVSPWSLKMLGLAMEIGQLYTTRVYRVNDNGVYLPKDMMECGMVMEADGRGKFLRKILKSDKPVEVRLMIEAYLVDSDYLTKEEAKAEYKKKNPVVEFVIPSTVPPLNDATRQMVQRANAQPE